MFVILFSEYNYYLLILFPFFCKMIETLVYLLFVSGMRREHAFIKHTLKTDEIECGDDIDEGEKGKQIMEQQNFYVAFKCDSRFIKRNMKML